MIRRPNDGYYELSCSEILRPKLEMKSHRFNSNQLVAPVSNPDAAQSTILPSPYAAPLVSMTFSDDGLQMHSTPLQYRPLHNNWLVRCLQLGTV
mmetsp:Transcript_20366/g.43924  ORF Transcript_20366/g.43924 Transcript_20366/m.43924 type:complete len:94 (+) Transcript_20366:3574-3855(+)